MYKSHSEVTNFYFFFQTFYVRFKVRVFQCFKMCCVVFKASSVKHRLIIFFPSAAGNQ